MQRISHKLAFKPSVSSDVVEHRVRILPHGKVFSYDAAYASIGDKVEIPMPEVEMGSTIYITAVDVRGNESDCLTLEINDMAFLKSQTLRFKPSASADYVEHRVRIAKDGVAFNYNLPFASLQKAQVPAGTDGKITTDLSKLANVPKEEGTYDVWVTAVDAKGNESDPLVIENAVFDFNPPAAPTEGEIV